MRKAVLAVIGGLVLLLAAGGGWYWWTEARFLESTDNAYVQSDISVVSPEIEGYVREVRVVDNQRVAAGEVLVVIDNREFTAEVAKAEATLAERRAALAGLDSQFTLQKSLIAQAAATVASAEADLARARQDYDRYRGLVKEDFVSRQRFETAEADRRKAEAALAEARAAHAAAKDQVGVLEAARSEAAAKLRQAEAALTIARTDLDDTVIRAPVDGVVGNRGVRVGEYVRPGTQLLAVVPLPRVYVVANFKETQLSDMRPGQPVTLAIDAFPDVALTGRVESFAPASGAQFSLLPPENATGNFTKIVQRVPVRIAVPADNPLSGLLRPGLSVIATVDTRADGVAQASIGGIFGVAQATPAAPGDAPEKSASPLTGEGRGGGESAAAATLADGTR